ncbi:MAG: hypothetical protein AAGK66_09475 [Pseudomonadota bacterium]
MTAFREHLERRIGDFLDRHAAFTPTRMGREFNGDPHVIHRFLSGRSMTLRTADALLEWMAAYDARSALETTDAA